MRAPIANSFREYSFGAFGEIVSRTHVTYLATLSHRNLVAPRGQQETTVSGVLARELDVIASALIEELRSALPGFAEAMAWPG